MNNCVDKFVLIAHCSFFFVVVKFRNHNISWLSNVGIMTTLLASNPVFFLSLHFVFMVIILLFTWLFIVFSVSIHVIDSSTACWNPQRAVCDICHCLLGATPCFPRLTSALPDGSRDTRRAAQDGNTGFSSWGACSLGEMRWDEALSLSLSLQLDGACQLVLRWPHRRDGDVRMGTDCFFCCRAAKLRF